MLELQKIYPVAASGEIYSVWPIEGNISPYRYFNDIDYIQPSLLEESFEKATIIYGKILEGWILIKPLNVGIEKADDGFVVSENVFGIYGTGDSIREALKDYFISLVDYYQLISYRSEDNQATKEFFSALRSYLNPINDANKT